MNAPAEHVANPFASAPVVAAPTGATANALVQREIAEVQGAMVIAKRFPRDPKVAMDRILNACTRPGLADAGVYEYSRGGQAVTGPSIRLAEEMARGWGNILSGVTELARNAGVSECLAYAWDLETNFRDEKRFQVRHWRDTKSGGYAIKDERDIYELIANMGARRKRACILAIIPGDVQEAAVNQCNVTLQTTQEVTPERLKAMREKFAEIGVTQEMIEKRIQRRFDAITPALLMNLGRIFNSIRDGMSAAGDWFEMPQPPVPPEAGTDAPGLAGLKAALKKPETGAQVDADQQAGVDEWLAANADPAQEPAPAPNGKAGRGRKE